MVLKKKPTILKAPRPGPPVPEDFIGHESATMMAEETFEEFEARMKRGGDAPEAPHEDTHTNTSPALDPHELTREAPVDPDELPPDEEPAPMSEDDYLPREPPPSIDESAEDEDEDFLPPEA